MKINKSLAIILAIIIISFIIAIYVYPLLPDRIASHWNMRGEIDGYMSKFWGTFLMPVISIILLLAFIFLPRLDPLKKNVDQFRMYFESFIIVIFLFFFYIFLLTIFWNLGKRFNIGQMLAPAFAILWFFGGILVGKAKQNWFIGIRTPWTLSSDKSWEKTHALGAKFFKVSAFIALAGLIFPTYAIYFVMIPVIFFAIYLIVYSYFVYNKP